jgi:hypothetical protein
MVDGNPHRTVIDKPLTKPQQRELLYLAGHDQVTFGNARARVQNKLVAMGLARFLDVDGIAVCRITDAGRKAWMVGRAPPRPTEEGEAPSADDLRRHLRSLRAERDALRHRLSRLNAQWWRATEQLEALEEAERP